MNNNIKQQITGKNRTALVTSGATIEKIDPVRFISNFSSGKQGHAIAQSLVEHGFAVTLISGPVNIPTPEGVKIINVQTAQEMLDACLAALPVHVAVCVAAVCDFRPETLSPEKIKKTSDLQGISLNLIPNADILKTISNHEMRPKIVVGFAAETKDIIENATLKLSKKNCDIIVANDVSSGNIFGKNDTCVTLISHKNVKQLTECSKKEVADILTEEICKLL